MSTAVFEGGCLCGAVRYRAAAEPIFTGTCHCRDCQRATGSAFACTLAVPAAALVLSGALTRHSTVGESGRRVTRAFCPVCGGRVMAEAEAMPGVAMIEAGSLDDAASFVLEAHIFRDSAQCWFPFTGVMQTFARMPPAG